MPDRRHLIFINYRGSVQNWATELVYARMTEAFGPDAVFKAGNSIRPSEHFPPILRRQAASCPVMLACIGPGWLDAGASGRRLDSPDDWVRREIALSLEAANHVIPLLIGNLDEVAIPAPRDLPEDIRAMAFRQAVRLVPGGGLDLTIPKLVDTLADLVPELNERRAERRSPIPVPDDQYTSLAARGAVSLAAAMPTGWWSEARAAACAMFALVEPTRRAALVDQLDKDRNTLASTAAQARDRMADTIAARWEGRLEELLARHPAMRETLDAMVGRLQALTAQPEGARVTVNKQYVKADNYGSAYGAQHGNVYHFASPTPPSSTPPSTATPPDNEPIG